MNYRTRGYLPHLELPASTYFLTFRLSGILPQTILAEFKSEMKRIREISNRQNRALTPQEITHLKYLESSRIQKYLDTGIGECWLKQPKIAQMAKLSLQHFEGSRYVSHAFCIMHNHVHWLVSPIAQNDQHDATHVLVSITHSIKSYTAHEANKILYRKGPFWSKEYYDHIVRTSEEFGRLLIYTLENPVRAGLCGHWEDWPWTEKVA